MNVQLAIWLASLAGAGLFFAAGALLTRARAKAVVAETGTAAALPAPDEGVTRALAEAERALAASQATERDATAQLQAQVRELEARRADSQAEAAARAATESRLRSALQERERAEAELKQARSQLAAAGPLANEVASLRAQLAAQAPATVTAPHPAELASIKAELQTRVAERDRFALELAAHKNKVAQLSLLERERDDLLRRIGEAERLGAERADPKELADARYELTMVRQVSEARLADNQRLSDEMARLKASLSEVGTLKERVAQLSRDLVEAKAKDLTQSDRAPVVELQAGGVHRFQRLVDRVASIDGVRSVAVADHQGFVVAGVGEHADGLGAISAFLVAATVRVSGVLPFRLFRRLLVEDEGGLLLSSYRLPAEEHDLVLSILTVGNESETRIMNALTSETTGVSQHENTAPITRKDANVQL